MKEEEEQATINTTVFSKKMTTDSCQDINDIHTIRSFGCNFRGFLESPIPSQGKHRIVKGLGNPGKYIILCYNHFPRHVREAAESLAFGVVHEITVTEGDKVWVSQILVLKK